MAEERKGFLGRWSQRKAEVLKGKLPADPAPAQAVPPDRPVVSDKPAAQVLVDTTREPVPTAARNGEGAAPRLTLEDARLLTSDSDFKPFMTSRVEPGVRNAAMKKLFSDPHYNIMDGLDIYIDDYSKSDPIPESMLRQMVGAKFLNLFGEDKDTENPEIPQVPRENANNDEVQTVAHSTRTDGARIAPSTDGASPISPLNSQPEPLPSPPGSGASHQDHANTDLRLQPDDAAPGPKAGRSAE
jgi:hypothetical protein